MIPFHVISMQATFIDSSDMVDTDRRIINVAISMRHFDMKLLTGGRYCHHGSHTADHIEISRTDHHRNMTLCGKTLCSPVLGVMTPNNSSPLGRMTAEEEEFVFVIEWARSSQ